MTAPIYCNDKVYKFGYNSVSHKVRFNRDYIGPHASDSIPVLATFSDADSIIVDNVSGNDVTGLGTIALPYLTLTKGANLCTPTRPRVVVISSGLISDTLSTIDNDYFEGFHSSTGATHTYRVLSSTGAIYIAKAGSDANPGTSVSPKLTLTGTAGAISATDASHQIVIIQDSGTYDEEGFEFSGNFKGIYAEEGQAPTINTGYGAIDYSASFTLLPIEQIIDTPLSFAPRIASFADGSYAIVHQDHTTSNGPLYVSTYSPTGAATIEDTVITARGGAAPAVAVTSDDYLFVIYRDWTDIKDKLIIYSKILEILYGPAILPTAAMSMPDMAVRSDDSIVVSYQNTSDETCFMIINADGSIHKTETIIKTGSNYYSSVAVFSDGGFVISYGYAYSGYYAIAFQIFDETGTQTKAHTIPEGPIRMYATHVGVFSDDTWMLTYFAAANDIKYAIYNQAGTETKAPTTIATCHIYDYRLGIFVDDSAIISYQDTVNADTRYQIINKIGTVIKVETILTAARYNYNNIIINKIQSLIFAGRSNADTFGYQMISIPYLAGSISAVVDAVIDGVTLHAGNIHHLNKYIQATGSKLTLHHVALDSFTFTGATPLLVDSDDEIDIQECTIHDNAAGIYADTNTATIKDNLIYRNTGDYAVHIKGAGTGIDIQHNTIHGNASGLKLENNAGTEIVKNNIFSDNSVYNIDAETAITTSYSILTGTSQNVTEGSGIIHANPQYENEGDYVPADTDLHLKLRILGDHADSPAYTLADDTAPERDAGAWDTIAIGEATNWLSATITKPINGIEVTYEAVGATLTKKKSGDIDTSLDAFIQIVSFSHDGLSNTEFALLLDVITCGSNVVRWYGDPETYPNNYKIYKIIYENFKGSAKNFRLNKTGKQDIKLQIARAYED